MAIHLLLVLSVLCPFLPFLSGLSFCFLSRVHIDLHCLISHAVAMSVLAVELTMCICNSSQRHLKDCAVSPVMGNSPLICGLRVSDPPTSDIRRYCICSTHVQTLLLSLFSKWHSIAHTQHLRWIGQASRDSVKHTGTSVQGTWRHEPWGISELVPTGMPRGDCTSLCCLFHFYISYKPWNTLQLSIFQRNLQKGECFLHSPMFAISDPECLYVDPSFHLLSFSFCLESVPQPCLSHRSDDDTRAQFPIVQKSAEFWLRFGD